MTMDYAKARELMVEQQVRPWDVLDARVLDALVSIPRDAFVPAAHRALSYADAALPLGHGEMMMKPVLEGRTLQSLDVQAGDVVQASFAYRCGGSIPMPLKSASKLALSGEVARGAIQG